MMSNCQRFNENISSFGEINGKFLVTIWKQVKAINSASGQARSPHKEIIPRVCAEGAQNGRNLEVGRWGGGGGGGGSCWPKQKARDGCVPSVNVVEPCL